MGDASSHAASAQSYGAAFADIYDTWYANVSDVAGTVKVITELAVGGQVLELGIGTGRLALPLAAAGLTVIGIDASPAMLDKLQRKLDLPTAPAVLGRETRHMDPFCVTEREGGLGRAGIASVLGDMAALPFRGGFSVVFVAFNTLFNLDSHTAMRRCFNEVARVLSPGGRLVVEAFVPPPADESVLDGVSVREISTTAAVLTKATRHLASNTIEGTHIELSGSGVRLRPWRICYAAPHELDEMAAGAGLILEARWPDWHGAPFTEDCSAHVSVYRKTG